MLYLFPSIPYSCPTYSTSRKFGCGKKEVGFITELTSARIADGKLVQAKTRRGGSSWGWWAEIEVKEHQV
jgi:hypothetical protein